MEIPSRLLPRIPENWLNQQVWVVQKASAEATVESLASHSPTPKSQPFSEILAKHPKTLVVLVRHPG